MDAQEAGVSQAVPGLLNAMRVFGIRGAAWQRLEHRAELLGVSVPAVGLGRNLGFQRAGGLRSDASASSRTRPGSQDQASSRSQPAVGPRLGTMGAVDRVCITVLYDGDPCAALSVSTRRAISPTNPATPSPG